MKQFLSLTLITVAILSFTSCIKTAETPQPPAVDPLVGSWYLYDASESYGNNWYPFDPGIYGILSFYKNGSAQYDDGNFLLNGYWYSSYISDGYYDQYGNYYTDLHQNLEASFSGGSNSFDLYFDEISFAGHNTFIGTYFTGKNIQRYTFKRY